MELKEQLEKDLIAWNAVICATQGAMMMFEFNLKDVDNKIASGILNASMENMKKALKSAQDAKNQIEIILKTLNILFN